MERLELCELVSKEYAQIAKARGRDYTKSYNSYMARAEKRSTELLEEHAAQIRMTLSLTKTTRRTEEYSLDSLSDDDCEDGVCKL